MALRISSSSGLATVAAIAATVCSAIAAAPAVAAPDRPDRLALQPVRDRVIEGNPGVLRRASVSAAGGYYSDGDGHTVYVERDATYTSANAQQAVDVLGGLAHGSEMNSLSVLLATPQHIANVCGPGALACYFPDAEEMVISGAGTPAQGGNPSRDFVIAHEYGHHLAQHRSNAPWSALDWGPKRWTDAEGVCPAVRAGNLFPGDEGVHYWDDPGENFAESFAVFNYPGEPIGWDYNSMLEPNQAAFNAIAADVSNPWTHNRTTQWSGTLSAGQAATGLLVDTPLDGRLKVVLDGPSNADFDLSVLSGGVARRVLARSASSSSNETLRFTVCGRDALRVRVVRYRGLGPFSARISRP